MNANELADELDEAVLKLVADDHFTEAQAVEECQTMLRQQHAEIEALKARCNSLKEANDSFARHSIANPANELGFQQIELNAELLRKAQENV